MSLPPVTEPVDLSALGPLAHELAQTFVTLASDIALVIDADGVIRQVAQRSGEALAPGASGWVGRAWAETVTGDTRGKIELLLQEVVRSGVARRREVNHPGGNDGIPVAYSAIRLGAQGPVLAVGRDLRAIAAIQQRYLEAQNELERGYWKIRQSESSERELAQTASEAVVVVDAHDHGVLAANAAAAAIASAAGEPVIGRPVAALFDAHSRGAVDALLLAARTSGRPMELRARLAGLHRAVVTVSATPLLSAEGPRLMMRVRDLAVDPGHGTREAVCIADMNGRLLSYSAAFAALADPEGGLTLRGRSLGDWLDAAPLIALARQRGIVSRERCAWRADARLPAATVHAEVTLRNEGDQEGFAFVIRPLDGGPGHGLLHDAFRAVFDALDQRLGREDLRGLLKETAAMTEAHLIRAALARSGGDAAAAARLLGISRAALQRRRRKANDGGGA